MNPFDAIGHSEILSPKPKLVMSLELPPEAGTRSNGEVEITSTKYMRKVHEVTEAPELATESLWSLLPDWEVVRWFKSTLGSSTPTTPAFPSPPPQAAPLPRINVFLMEETMGVTVGGEVIKSFRLVIENGKDGVARIIECGDNDAAGTMFAKLQEFFDVVSALRPVSAVAIQKQKADLAKKLATNFGSEWNTDKTWIDEMQRMGIPLFKEIRIPYTDTLTKIWRFYGRRAEEATLESGERPLYEKAKELDERCSRLYRLKPGEYVGETFSEWARLFTEICELEKLHDKKSLERFVLETGDADFKILE